MQFRYSLITDTALLALLGAGCATDRDGQLQQQTLSISRGRYLLAATNDAPGSFYELGVYVIGKGDTLAKIAGQFHVSVADIAAVNPGLNPNRLIIGQRVRIYERKKE